MNSQLCLIVIFFFLNGFNISCSLGKQSNKMVYGFSSVKCATSGILPVSRREQKEVDDFFKSTSCDKSTDCESPSIYVYLYMYIKIVILLFKTNKETVQESGYYVQTLRNYICAVCACQKK